MSERIAIVGGGIAGALLAWRLSRSPYHLRPVLYTGQRPSTTNGAMDATGASGGLVRAFEPDPGQCREASESLAELLGDPILQAWAGFREIGSVYILRPEPQHDACMATAAEAVPGSMRVVSPRELASTHPFQQLPESAVCIVEERAGYLSASELRAAVLLKLLDDGVTIRREAVASVLPEPAVRVCLADGTAGDYDTVVIAAGAWTPTVLRNSGLPAGDLRTKQIQYSLCDARLGGLGAFVDQTSGLYGRSNGQGGVLIGLPCDIWNIDPAAPVPDPELASRVVAEAAARFGPAWTGAEQRGVVAAVDCFADDPGLRLRRVDATSPIYTFTAGSGTSAKTALAASRTAAKALAA